MGIGIGIGIEGVRILYIIDEKSLKPLLRRYLKQLTKLQHQKDNFKNKGLLYHRVEETGSG